jgi:hypothetical protein
MNRESIFAIIVGVVVFAGMAHGELKSNAVARSAQKPSSAHHFSFVHRNKSHFLNPFANVIH